MLRAPLLTAAGRPGAARLRVGFRPPAGRAALIPALGLGVLAALLFSTTFVANRSIHLGGGAWEWTASLRYLMMLPLLAVVVAWRGGLAPVAAALARSRAHGSAGARSASACSTRRWPSR